MWATTGLTFVVPPSLSTVLFAAAPVLPVALGAVTMAVVCMFVSTHRRSRQVGHTETSSP